MNKLCVIGGATLDEYYSCKNWIQAGDKALIHSMGRRIGGTTFNAAAVACSLGLSTAMLEIMNTASDDGVFLREQTSAFGVDFSKVIHDDNAKNPRAIIFLLDGGERTVFVELEVRPDSSRIALWQSELDDCSYIYSMATTLTGFDGADEVLKRAKEHGTRLVLDCDARFEDEREVIFTSMCDYPIFNRFSYDAFSNKVGNDAAEYLLNNGACAVIQTLDSEGVAVHTSAGKRLLPAVKVEVRDTTGAGDTFSGAFIYALSGGAEPCDAARFANYAAARCVTMLGATAGACDEQTLLDFIRLYSV